MSKKLTTDPNDPRINRTGTTDAEPGPENEAYLVLSDEERAKGFVRPLRSAYIHDTCGTETRMAQGIAETYARDPKFYGFTYCVHCQKHLPVEEFKWADTSGERVGS